MQALLRLCRHVGSRDRIVENQLKKNMEDENGRRDAIGVLGVQGQVGTL